MARLRIAPSLTIASLVLALAAGGCGDDEEQPSVATTPPAGVQTAPTATTEATTTPGSSTQPSGDADLSNSEAFGKYTLAVNGVLRESAEFSIAAQKCVTDKSGKTCVDKAAKKLDDVGRDYSDAAKALAKDAPQACARALQKSGDAVEALLDVLKRIGDAATSGRPEDFNAEARKISQTLQGRSQDLVAGQAACGR